MKARSIDAPSDEPVQTWTMSPPSSIRMSLGNDGPSHFTTRLTTINADGSPHVTAVGAVW